MTSTRVIAVSHDVPAERADDRNDAAGPNRAQAAMGRRGKPETSSPRNVALVALVRLLARQAAEEDFRSQG